MTLNFNEQTLKLKHRELQEYLTGVFGLFCDMLIFVAMFEYLNFIPVLAGRIGPLETFTCGSFSKLHVIVRLGGLPKVTLEIEWISLKKSPPGGVQEQF